MGCGFTAEVHDVIVVGGGPAGLMAAKTAAKKGLTVLLVELKRNITKIGRACASMVILDPGFHGEFVRVDRSGLTFPRNDFAVAYAGEWVDLTRSIRIAPSGSTFTLGDGKQVFAKVIEKEVLLEALLKDAVDTGVEIRNRTVGIAAENTADGTTVQLRTPEGRAKVRGRITIAADGGKSRIAANLGLNAHRTLFAVGEGGEGLYSYFLEGVDCPYPNSWIRFMGSELQGGAFMLPKPPRERAAPVLYEVMAPGITALNRLVSESRFAPWFRHARIVRRRSVGGEGLYAPLTKPVVGNVMIVGDAACWQEVEIQGALMCGYRAAHAASQELETGGNALELYSHFWKCAFEFCWPGVVERSMKFLHMHGTLFNDEELEYVYKLCAHDRLPGSVNHFKVGTQEVNAYMRHIDQVRRDKPALAKKLEALARLTKYS